jgi:hypothetical protein
MPGPSRLSTVIASNNSAAPVNPRQRRPPATGPRRLLAAANKPDRVTNNISTGIRSDAVSRHRPSGESHMQRTYHAPIRPSGVTWRA